MVVSDHVTPKGKSCSALWTTNCVDHTVSLNVVEDRNTSCPCQEFNPIRHPACSLVNTLTGQPSATTTLVHLNLQNF
jgi:hypothetical protein